MPCVSLAWLVWLDFVLFCMVEFSWFLRVWLLPHFVSLRVSVRLFVVFESPCFAALLAFWLEPCVLQRFLLCMSFDVAYASARLVRFALSFCCGHWFFFCGIFVRFRSTSPPGGNQVDGLPPVSTYAGREILLRLGPRKSVLRGEKK